MYSKQAGFSIVEGVIAIVVVAILGLVGWSVYNAYNHPTKKTANATTNTTSTSQPSNETTNGATTTPQSTYLDIKELGVKITLSNPINDAVYAPYYTPSTDNTTTVGFSTQSLANNSSIIACSASHGALGILIESPTPFLQPPQGTSTIAPDGKTVFKIGNNYYMYRAPQNLGCATGSVSTGAVTSDLQAIKQAITTLQPDN